MQAKGMNLFWWLLGRSLLALAAALALPLGLSLWRGEHLTTAFLLPLLLAAGSGVLALMQGHGEENSRLRTLTVREGAWYIVAVWPIAALISMLPYILAGILAPVAAFFESMSALTTTGLSCLDFARENAGVPFSLALWHSLMSWRGAMNFVIIMVTVLPQVSGCFGITLTARQTMHFSPVWKRLRVSARQGVAVYMAFSLFAFILFYMAGLDPLHALIGALTAISSGGDSSIYAFMIPHDAALELAAGVTMLLSGTSMLLCWQAFARRSLRLLWQDDELRTYLAVVGGAGLLLAVRLMREQGLDLIEGLRYGLFQAVSFASGNGFFSAPAWVWPDGDRLLLMLLAVIGGCMGSAAGGLHIVRLKVLLKLTKAELRHTLHPRMVVSVRIDGLPVPVKIVGRILAFFFLYVVVLILFSILLSATGLTLMSSLALAVGCMTSTGSVATLYGIGLGGVGALPAWGQLVCCLLMVIGRVEIFSFLVLVDLGLHSLARKW